MTRDEKLREIIYWHTCKIVNITEEGGKTDNEDKEICDIYKDTLSQINQLFSEGKDNIFISHIESHLSKGEKVICKICGKTAEEICNTEKNQ